MGSNVNFGPPQGSPLPPGGIPLKIDPQVKKNNDKLGKLGEKLLERVDVFITQNLPKGTSAERVYATQGKPGLENIKEKINTFILKNNELGKKLEGKDVIKLIHNEIDTNPKMRNYRDPYDEALNKAMEEIDIAKIPEDEEALEGEIAKSVQEMNIASRTVSPTPSPRSLSRKTSENKISPEEFKFLFRGVDLKEKTQRQVMNAVNENRSAEDFMKNLNKILRSNKESLLDPPTENSVRGLVEGLYKSWYGENS